MKKVDQHLAALRAAGRDLAAEILAKCEEVGECLEWPGPYGSGRNRCSPLLRARIDEHRENLPVLRILWEAKRGPIPDGKIIYRHCCNDRCVGCLRIGERGAAHRRRKQLGLMKHSASTLASLTRGARNRGNLKCSEVQAAEIRELLAQGLTEREVSERTGMTRYVVADVRTGRSWKPVAHQASVFTWRPTA